MAWSWSHTTRAYHNAQRQMERLDRETREVIAAEWMAASKDAYGVWDSCNMAMRRYYLAKVRVQGWTDDKLNAFIWERMEELATCDNGGWEAWCCPYGCGCHTVPFDPPKAPRSENPAYRIEVVGVGVMCRSHDEEDAREFFDTYMGKSRHGYESKCYGKTVILFENDQEVARFTN